MWKRKILLIFLFLSLCFCSFSQQQQEQQQFTTGLRTEDLWNNIDLNLNLLEKEQQFSLIRLQELEKKLELSEKAYQDKEQVCLNLENSLEKLEKDTKRWKTCSLVLGTVALTTTLILVFSK